MLYLIFSIDGDWDEYFLTRLPEEKRLPQVEALKAMIKNEIKTAAQNLNGRFIHFVHTSPKVRNFFYNEPFVALWKQIIKDGGDVGLHCHEDDPYKAYYVHDSARMKQVIRQQAEGLRKLGLDICAYRGGFLAFTTQLISILEENNLCFDFSCEPERYLVDAGTVVSDWRSSPTSAYRMDYSNHRKKGGSKVYQIPLGSAKGHYLYFEKSEPQIIEDVASNLKERSRKESKDFIVSVLTHTAEYESQETIKSIEEKISILKKYGQFINLKELKNILNTKKE